MALFAAGLVIAQDTSSVPPKPVHSQKSAHKSSASKNKAAASKSATNKTAVNQTRASAAKPATHRRSSKTSKSKRALAASRRSAQQQPTPERYKEIQQALADRGYFNGPVDGNWGPDSVESLKRFQHDQNLTDDGKIGSLSLIALGLGPKRADVPPEKPTQR